MQDFKENGEYFNGLSGVPNYITTYCPDAYWILKVFGRKQRIAFKLREMCDLLM